MNNISGVWMAFLHADQALQELNKFHGAYILLGYIEPGDTWDVALVQVETYIERELSQLETIIDFRFGEWTPTEEEPPNDGSSLGGPDA